MLTTSTIHCVEVASLFATAILQRDPDSVVTAFDTVACEAKVEAGDTVLSLAERLARLGCTEFRTVQATFRVSSIWYSVASDPSPANKGSANRRIVSDVFVSEKRETGDSRGVLFLWFAEPHVIFGLILPEIRSSSSRWTPSCAAHC
jgi:hypothetical protein